MGLAASQAKLLSITSRISDNELRSQSITAAKMALSNETSEVSRKYINALSTNEFIYRTYDEMGYGVYTALTGSQLSNYAPLKNQYGLVNAQGQILVSELDASNYEASANLVEFLEKYGIELVDTGNVHTVTNPEYEEAYKEWYDNYLEWWLDAPEPLEEKYWDESEGTNSDLYNSFVTASKTCRGNAMGGTTGCYKHVLAHLLDLSLNANGKCDTSAYPKSYTTTLGDTVSFGSNQISGSAIYSHGDTPGMQEISDAIKGTYNGKRLYAAADSAFVSKYNLTEEDLDGDMSDPEYRKKRLLSNYTFDASGNIVLKTLEQKIVDMMYMIDNFNSMSVPYNPDMLDLIRSFEEDMSLAFTERVFNRDLFDQDNGEWLDGEPPALDVPATLDEIIYEYNDKEKAQWYINLWHRMNGESDDKDGTETVTSSSTSASVSSNGTTVTTSTETTTRNRWAVLEDGLMNSQDWLKYALETGAVSLERVNYSSPTEAGSGIRNATWTSIQYNNALDISEQTNETAIAKAEAEYEQKTRELENKDKQLDSMIKLLDTEHTALQTEYESVKTVIQKNTERTLKIYS